MTPQPRQAAEYRFQIVLWVAMVCSICLYFVVIRLIPPRDATNNPTFVNILLILAIALVGVSFFLKSHFLTRANQTGLESFRRMALIIALTSCEAAALFGVVTWFTTGSPKAYWFLGLGLVGQLLHFPVRSDKA